MKNFLLLLILCCFNQLSFSQTNKANSNDYKTHLEQIESKHNLTKDSNLILDESTSQMYLSRYTAQNTGTNEISGAMISSIFIDRSNKIFFLNLGGIDILDKGLWSHWELGKDLMGSVSMPTSGNMIQDKRGYYFVGTTNGLNVFKPDLSSHYTLTADNGLLNNRITTIAELKNGEIWLGHSFNTNLGYGGVSIIKTDGQVVHNTNGLLTGHTEDILQRSNGDVWVSTAADNAGDFGGITVFHEDGSFFIYDKSNSGLPQNEVTEMVEDHDGNVWVGLYPGPNSETMPGGIVKFDNENWTYYGNEQGIFNLNTWSIGVGSDGSVYRGSSSELQVTDGTNWHIVDNGNLKYPLGSTSSIQTTSNGDLYFSSTSGNTSGEGGLHHFNARLQEWDFMSSLNDGGIFDNNLFAVDVDTEGSVWISGFNGVSRFNGTTWDHFNETDGLATNYTWKFLAASDGTVWFATTQNGVSRYKDGNFEVVSDLTVFDECIYEDSKGNIWLGSYSNSGILLFDGTTFKTYTQADGLIGTIVTEISEGPDGAIYAATDAGLARFDGTSWSEQAVNGEFGNYVDEIFLDSRGYLWTTGISNYKWDGIIFQEMPKNGNYTATITESNDGTIWFAYNGLMAINVNDEAYYFRKNEGAPSSNIFDMTSLEDGSLLLATYGGGLYRFNQAEPVRIVEISDLPNDQGNWVNLKLDGFLLDGNRVESNPNHIASTYTVWRDLNGNWEPALTAPIYASFEDKSVSIQVPTSKMLEDNSDNDMYHFKVTAHNNTGKLLGESSVQTGYAVDNIAPQKVENVQIQETNNEIIISWKSPSDNDIDRFFVYDWNNGDYLASAPLSESFSNSTKINQPKIGTNIVVLAQDQHGNMGIPSDVIIITSNEENEILPTSFTLNSIYPNPFNPQAVVSFDVPVNGSVLIEAFNTLGHKVSIITNGTFSAGSHQVVFDGSNLASGSYFIRAQFGNQLLTKHVTLVK